MESCVRVVWHAAHAKATATHAKVQEDWASGVIPISMMGLQAQTVVGSMVGLIQSVYLAQFGARAAIISDYLMLALPINLMTSCITVAVLVGVSIRYSQFLFVLGCCTCLAASLALTFPPQLYSDPDQQATFLSHYFGLLFVIANAGAKLRDYPNGLARVYLLQGTHSRASEKAYNTIVDVMVGNGVNGALMLSLLANPSWSIKVGIALLQVFSTAVSLRGSFILRYLRDLGVVPASSATLNIANVVGVQGEEEGVLEKAALQRSAIDTKGRSTLREAFKLTMNVQVWQLMTVEWCAGFIFTLNSQAAGTIYWSSIVGVSDNMRSVFIALESILGGALLGFVSTLHVTRLYHKQQADVSVMIPRIVAVGAIMGSSLLLFFGGTSVGALLGIVSLYLYYYIFPWSNMEFLSILDALRAKHSSDNPLLYMFLIKDIAGGLLNNFRNMALMWALAATGFYEPDCNSKCSPQDATAGDDDCIARCHAESHASITDATVTLVRALYVVVTPGAYLLACIIIRRYKSIDARTMLS